MLARAVLVLGCVLVGATLVGALPRETAVEVALGGAHANVVEVSVAYEREGETLHGGRFTFAQGAPERLRHHVSVSPGELEVRIELRERSGETRLVTRRMRVPAEGTVRLSVGSEAP